MGFGKRRSFTGSRRPGSRPPAQAPLGETRKFLGSLLSGPKELIKGSKPVPKPSPVGRPKPLVKPTELVPVDEAGAALNDTLVKGDTIAVKGRPATVQGHSRRGGLLVTPGPTPAPMDLTDRSNRPKGYGPDHGPAGDESDMEKEGGGR